MEIVKIVNQSGFSPSRYTSIQTVKRNQYEEVSFELSVGGERSEESIWLRSGTNGTPASLSPSTINRVGHHYGFNIAKSHIARVFDQIRFLSENFINRRFQQLVHGAELYAGYLNDKDFIDEIESQRLERDLLSYQFTMESLNFAFPNQFVKLKTEFNRMILFDALVSNNDRHMYNWEVVRNPRGGKEPYYYIGVRLKVIFRKNRHSPPETLCFVLISKTCPW